MTDAHCHAAAQNEDGITRRFICAASRADWDILSNGQSATTVSFYGIHPWFVEKDFTPDLITSLREKLESNNAAGVGEIGLDRLRSRDEAIFEKQKPAFHAQLDLAAELHRAVVLHGAKCWGEVVKTVSQYKARIPVFLFHGFSRTPGLVSAIADLNGFFSISSAITNDHAVNYRELVKTIPRDRLLVETDAPKSSEKPIPSFSATVEALASVIGTDVSTLSDTLEANADRFIDAM